MLLKTIMKRIIINWKKMLGLGILFLISMSVGLHFENLVTSHDNYKVNTIKTNKLQAATIYITNDNNQGTSLEKYLNQKYSNFGKFELISNKVIDLNKTKKGDLTPGIDPTNITKTSVNNYTQVQKENKNIILVSGKDKLNDGEVLINLSYSQEYNKKVNDSIILNNKKFKIKGIYNNYRVLVKSKLTPNNNILLNDNEFNKLNALEKSFIEFKSDNVLSLDKLENLRNTILNDDFSKTKINSMALTFENPQTNVGNFDEVYRVISTLMFFFFGFISIVLTCVVITQIIQNMTLIFSTLKTLGYQKRKIIKNMVIIFSVFYLVLAIISQIISYYSSYGNIVNENKDLYIKVSTNINIINFKFIVLVAFFIGVIIFTIITKTNKILSLNVVDIKTFQQSKYKIIKFINNIKFKNIRKKIRFKILLSSPLRAFSLYLGSIFGSFLLIVFMILVTSLFNDFLQSNKKPISNEINYDVVNTFKQGEHEFYFNGFNVIGSNFKTEKKLSKYTTYPLRLLALTKNQMTSKKLDNEIIKNSDNGIIITKQFAKTYNIKIGSVLKVVNPFSELKEYNLKVSGISSENFISYTSLDFLKKSLNLKNPYNASFNNLTNQNANTVKKLDLLYVQNQAKSAIKNILPASISGCVIAFLFIMPIISICSGFVIEENKKNISILKSIGYQYKEINSMLVNVYTIILFLGCLTSTILSIFLIDNFLVIMQNTGMRTVGDLKWNIYANILGVILTYILYIITIKLNTRKIKKKYLKKEL